MPKRVYLQPKDIVRKSKFHTAYVGDGPIHPDGTGGQLYKLEFVDGVAMDVPEQLYQRFKDAGVAGASRPKRPEDEADEEG